MNDDCQAILKLSHSSNTLILDKVWHIPIATNCHLSFTNYPVGFLYSKRGETSFHGGISKRAPTFC